jgi:deazaflavin-dependent oxidoreductase (nitroreductase family)
LIDPSSTSTPSLAQWADLPFAYLTTTGRRTGAPHRIEIWFAVDQGTLFLLSGGRDRSDWVQNLLVNPNVSIELGTDTFAGVARVIPPDDPEDRHARELLVQKYRTGNELAEWGRTSLPVMITVASQAETRQEQRP